MIALAIVAGWVVVVFIGLLGLVVLWKIFDNTINLKFLISETDGQASMSRFQFLVFTFVIAMSFFLITVSGSKLPQVPEGVWALLGISGGSYVIAKGIQKSGETVKGATATAAGEAQHPGKPG
jgi:hypothetical protein